MQQRTSEERRDEHEPCRCILWWLYVRGVQLQTWRAAGLHVLDVSLLHHTPAVSLQYQHSSQLLLSGYLFVHL